MDSVSERTADIGEFLRDLLRATLQYRNAPGTCQLEMLRQVYEPLLNMLLPGLCRRCGAATDTGFCRECRGDFVRNERPCRICGCGPLREASLQCPSHPAHWCITRVVAPLLYVPPLANYLHALKYCGERMIGRSLGRILAEAAGERHGSIDALICVPLHAQRLAERGYNQALEIACELSAESRLPILCAGIERNKATLPQAQLSCAARHANLTGAFTITRALSGKRIAIVDDVITTGATVNALAAELLRAGACHVEAWAVARTQPAMSNAS